MNDIKMIQMQVLKLMVCAENRSGTVRLFTHVHISWYEGDVSALDLFNP